MDALGKGRIGFGRAFGGPGKYIQRAGEIDRLSDHLRPLGANAFLLVDSFVFDTMGDDLRRSLANGGAPHTIERFNGECCSEEIARVEALAQAQSATVVVGDWRRQDDRHRQSRRLRDGARLADRADHRLDRRAVQRDRRALHAGRRLSGSDLLPRNPDVVVVDSAVVAKAPARFLIAGVGDALSTWFEARSNVETCSQNYIASGFPAPAAGLALAKACYDVLMRDAFAAKFAVERGALTQAVENIIEANTLLSGLGFENCGVSGGHGIHDGLTALDETHGFFHGEKVAFGTLCLLMLEGRPLAEIEFDRPFCRSLGLPTTLRDLKLGQGEQGRHRAGRGSRARAGLGHLALGRAALGRDRARRHPRARRLHLDPRPAITPSSSGASSRSHKDTSMQAAVMYKPGDIRLEDVPKPEAKRGRGPPASRGRRRLRLGHSAHAHQGRASHADHLRP